jgi:hypothetical protein
VMGRAGQDGGGDVGQQPACSCADLVHVVRSAPLRQQPPGRSKPAIRDSATPFQKSGNWCSACRL